ncbi:hypothetical protein H8959_022243 [Pygathrix nigripes]
MCSRPTMWPSKSMPPPPRPALPLPVVASAEPVRSASPARCQAWPRATQASSIAQSECTRPLTLLTQRRIRKGPTFLMLGSCMKPLGASSRVWVPFSVPARWLPPVLGQGFSQLRSAWLCRG